MLFRSETEKTINVHSIREKFLADGWVVIGKDITWNERGNSYRDGHDIVYMINSFQKAKEIGHEGKPICIIANTDKGHGVSFMIKEKGEWHGKAPNDELYEKAVNELFIQLDEVRKRYDEIIRFCGLS